MCVCVCVCVCVCEWLSLMAIIKEENFQIFFFLINEGRLKMPKLFWKKKEKIYQNIKINFNDDHHEGLWVEKVQTSLTKKINFNFFFFKLN